MRLPLLLCCGMLLFPVILTAQTPDISPDSLRVSLYNLAADSMGGRQAGGLGDWKAQAWDAGHLGRLGLQPAGDNGTFCQVIPFARDFIDPAAHISVAGGR